MRTRVILTAIWLGGFFAAIGVLESYFLRATPAGIPFLLPADRTPIYTMLGLIYGANIAAILAAWFTKPFPPPKKARTARVLSGLAVVLTLTYNLILLYLIAQGHFSQQDSVEVIIERVKAIGGTLAFLVAPVNAYFFGARALGAPSRDEGGRREPR